MKSVWIITDSEGLFRGVFSTAKKAYKYLKAEVKKDYREGWFESRYYYLEHLVMLKDRYKSTPNDFEIHGLTARKYHVD